MNPRQRDMRAMERKFDTTLQYGSDYTWITIRGVIDEDNSMARLSSRITGSLLVLDLAEVERINSCGVRDWVNWLHNVSATGIQIVMIRCSPAIINQVNMVTNFIGDAVIHSFFAPYFNPETEEEKSVLLFTKDVIGQSPVRAPEVRCEETGYLLEFDDFEESYFAFAASATDPGTLSAQTMQLIESLTPELSSRNATSNERTTKMTQQGALDAAAAAAALATRGGAGPATSPQTPALRQGNAGFSSAEATVPRPAPKYGAQVDSGAETQPVPATSVPAPSFVTDPRAAANPHGRPSSGLANPQAPGAFAESLEADGRSSAVIIGILGGVLVLVLVLLLWLTLS